MKLIRLLFIALSFLNLSTMTFSNDDGYSPVDQHDHVKVTKHSHYHADDIEQENQYGNTENTDHCDCRDCKCENCDCKDCGTEDCPCEKCDCSKCECADCDCQNCDCQDCKDNHRECPDCGKDQNPEALT